MFHISNSEKRADYTSQSLLVTKARLSVVSISFRNFFPITFVGFYTLALEFIYQYSLWFLFAFEWAATAQYPKQINYSHRQLFAF